ncbi:MAG: amidophosphoribosyltransferase [Spirochaetales bacterium]|nr:amidophosphoribosyltransferase [Spirochaetales bacterium]
MDNINEKLGHYCGVVGIYSEDKINIPESLFYPLFSLQHRGQECCGISYRRHGHIITYKDVGMVSQVLTHYLQEDHPSHIGIGHVRYSTQGSNKLENAQPVMAACNKGEISIAHNGNISNSNSLRAELLKQGSIIQSTSDTEIILHLMSLNQSENFEDVLIQTLKKLEGAFSMVLIHNQTLYAIRDPHGFRPLVMGKKGGMTVFASETCALDILQAEFVREIKAGEIVAINEEGERSIQYHDNPTLHQCIFELIYFARPDSEIFNHSVHLTRKKMGQYLAMEDRVETDIVAPVPDSGNSAALGFAEATERSLEMGLTRNHYTGRTFIQPRKSQREFGVRIKLHPVKAVTSGRSISLIDDSLVRGTTSKIIVKLMRESGAKEIHLRLSAPEIKYPCYYGIDIPTREELISNHLTPDEIAREIGADSVHFISIESLRKCVDNPDNFCFACFNGDYPVKVKEEDLPNGEKT